MINAAMMRNLFFSTINTLFYGMAVLIFFNSGVL